MKAVHFIIAVYMLLLGSIPCGDGRDCIEDSVIAKTTQQDTPSHEDHKEHCTPFCACACCAVPIIVQPGAIAFMQQFSILSPKVKLYAEDFSSCNLHNIWQPPKV